MPGMRSVLGRDGRREHAAGAGFVVAAGVVSDNPADTSPHVLITDTSYDVRAFAQVGNTIYAGGRFARCRTPP